MPAWNGRWSAGTRAGQKYIRTIVGIVGASLIETVNPRQLGTFETFEAVMYLIDQFLDGFIIHSTRTHHQADKYIMEESNTRTKSKPESAPLAIMGRSVPTNFVPVHFLLPHTTDVYVCNK